MKNFLFSHIRRVPTSLLIIISLTILCHGQIPDRNVNMVSGTTWPGGDPFLQRQNEPSIGVSSRNPLHLLAGANDYRTVDLPGLPGGEETGDAWHGVFKSFDGGLTWRSTLLPGYPQDNSAQGLASPNKGFQAGADPTVRAGTNGLFYFSGITFNRDEKGLGQIFVARFIDNNNNERDDTIDYLSTVVISGGTAGQFIDKPWLAVDIPRPGAGQCQIGTQTFPAGNVYLAYSTFLGGDPSNNPHTAVMFARSGNCGTTWTVTKISESYKLNQGTIAAINPATGAIYVAWRQFATTGESDAIVFTKSTNGGKSFTKGSQVGLINPFDQGSTSVSFRTNTYPTMAVDGDGRVYLAWAQRGVGPGGDARIVVTRSSDGSGWTTPVAADPSPARGHQIMPVLSFAAGKLMLVFYDLREDHTIGIFTPTSNGLFSETREPRGDLSPAPGEPAKVFNEFIADVAPSGLSALKRRHTIDVRASQANISSGNSLIFSPSERVSQYVFGSRPGSQVVEQLQVNPPNLPMFALGTKAFIGDYIDLGATTFVPKLNGGWAFNTTPSDSEVFHATWTDNRDVRPPLGATPPDWSKYTPTGSPGCDSRFTGSRNQNIYTARITAGLFVGSAGNTKSLGTVLVNGNAVLLQRAFSIFLQNTTASEKSFRLTIAGPQPVGGAASFEQFDSATCRLGELCRPLDVTIGPRSTVSRSVFVTSTDRRAMVVINVAEITAVGGNVVPGGLSGSVILNPDRTSPDLTDPNSGGQDIANAEVYNPDITTLPTVLSQDIANQDIANQDIANQDIANQDIANPDIANVDIANQDIANVDIANQDIANVDIANASISDATWSVTNDGNTATTYSVKLLQNIAAPDGYKVQLILYKTNTPLVARDCMLGYQRQNLIIANVTNPVFTSPSELTSTGITDPATTNATIVLGPGEQARLTVRVIHKSGTATFDISKGISPVLVAHGVNSLDARIGSKRSPLTLVVTNTMNSMPDGLKSRSYSATLQAVGGLGPYSWRVVEGALPVGLSLNSTTGAITGKPTVRGITIFTVEARDSASAQHIALRTLKIAVF